MYIVELYFCNFVIRASKYNFYFGSLLNILLSLILSMIKFIIDKFWFYVRFKLILLYFMFNVSDDCVEFICICHLCICKRQKQVVFVLQYFTLSVTFCTTSFFCHLCNTAIGECCNVRCGYSDIFYYLFHTRTTYRVPLRCYSPEKVIAFVR